MPNSTLRRACTRIADIALGLLALATIVGLVVAWPTRFGGSSTFVFVAGPSMEPALHSGDLVIARRTTEIAIGDLIVFRIPQHTPNHDLVIHRVIGGNAEVGFVTKGDNNPSPDAYHPTGADVVGKVWVHSRQGRWMLAAMRLTMSPMLWGAFATVVAFWVSWRAVGIPPRRPAPDA